MEMEDVSLSVGREEEYMEVDEVGENEIFTETEIFKEIEPEILIKIKITKRSITIYL